MIPDEKKPVPWGLPPLRSEVLRKQEQEQEQAQQTGAAATAESSTQACTSSSMAPPPVVHRRHLSTSSASSHGVYYEPEHQPSVLNEKHDEKRPFIDTPTPDYEPASVYADSTGSNGYAFVPPKATTPSLRCRMAVLMGGMLMIAGTMLYIRFVMYDPRVIDAGTFSPTTLGTGADTLLAVQTLMDAGFNANNTVAWDRLAEMTDLYGHRMTASKAYDRSVEWVLRTVKEQDANLTAYTEPVWVNEWRRGSESLRLFVPTRPGGFVDIPLLGLGNSVATPPEGVEAKVVPVHSFEELEQLGNATIAGNIVMFNYQYSGYGATARFRTRGAQQAEKYGALAVLVRTVTPDTSFNSVHTGSSTRASIPAAAISYADANFIERMYNRAKVGASKDHVFPRVKLVMNASLRENAKQSANIIIDLKGTEYPDQIILLSGHFDSWDVGVGAMDDGAGAFLAWEAARLISQVGRAPRRTIRVVMWNNEETLQRGARAYFEKHKTEIGNHRFAFESDIGVFEPWGLAVQADKTMIKNLRNYGDDLLKVLGAGNITTSDVESPGEDIAILCENGVPCAGVLSLNPENGAAPGEPRWDEHYFRYHHAKSDRVEVIDKHQLRRSAAALAAWAYLIADIY